jgi:hypothetical protein
MQEQSSKTIRFIGFIIITIVVIALIGLINNREKETIQPVITDETTTEQEIETPVNPATFSVTINQNDIVTANQEITGSVPGFWFFEGDFPVSLVDTNDNVFATVIATSPEDWMTANIIPFTVTTPATLSYTGPGKIIFTRNDPSDGESSIPASETTATVFVTFQ